MRVLPEGRHGVPVFDLAESDGVGKGEAIALGPGFHANVRVAAVCWVPSTLTKSEYVGRESARGVGI